MAAHFCGKGRGRKEQEGAGSSSFYPGHVPCDLGETNVALLGVTSGEGSGPVKMLQEVIGSGATGQGDEEGWEPSETSEPGSGVTWLHPAEEVQVTLELSLSKGRGPGIFIYFIYLFLQ